MLIPDSGFQIPDSEFKTRISYGLPPARRGKRFIAGYRWLRPLLRCARRRMFAEVGREMLIPDSRFRIQDPKFLWASVCPGRTIPGPLHKTRMPSTVAEAQFNWEY